MSVLSYTQDIPNPPNIPAQDVPNMKANTNALFDIWTRDHVGFNAGAMGSVSGQHLQVTFNQNVTPSIPTTPPVLFTSVVNSLPQLFWYSGDATHTSSQYVNNINGSTFLFGGVILKWGRNTIVNTQNTVLVVYPSDFPNGVFAITAIAHTSPPGSGSLLAVNGENAHQFNLNRAGTSGNLECFWFAIGN